MTSVSQQNLLKFAEEDERKGDLEAAIQNLEETICLSLSNVATFTALL